MTFQGHDIQCLTGRKVVGVLVDCFDNIRPTADAVITQAARVPKC